MVDNWRDKFAPHILARGKKYFEEGRVSRIQCSGNAYFATVEGTEDYEVEITLCEGSVEEMLCSCPYAEDNNCKHMAAVLFALEKEDTSVEELPPAKLPPITSHIPMEMPWLDAVDNLPDSVIRKELMKLADRDDRLKERIAVLYLGKLPEHQLQNWKADLQELAREYADRRGRIREEDTWDFMNDLSNFMESKLPLLFEVGAVMDAFRLIWIVMETALEWQIEEFEYDLDCLFQDCEEDLQKLFSLATDAQREEMLRWYQEHRNEDWPGGVSNMDYIFQNLKHPDIPMKNRRIVRYLENKPCFLCEGEWVPLPMQGDMYFDFVEETAEYKEAEPIIEEIIKENLGQRYHSFGSCHEIWRLRKQLLMEKYGIEWLSPAELNRDVDFD